MVGGSGSTGSVIGSPIQDRYSTDDSLILVYRVVLCVSLRLI